MRSAVHWMRANYADAEPSRTAVQKKSLTVMMNDRYTCNNVYLILRLDFKFCAIRSTAHREFLHFYRNFIKSNWNQKMVTTILFRFDLKTFRKTLLSHYVLQHYRKKTFTSVTISGQTLVSQPNSTSPLKPSVQYTHCDVQEFQGGPSVTLRNENLSGSWLM